jgi:hypothetical protein
MARYLRFVVNQRVPGERREVGLFTAAGHLLKEGELSKSDYREPEQLLSWFESELTVPPERIIPVGAVFWYSNVGPFSERMWALASLLDRYGFTTELVTGRFIGRIIWRDAHQFAAIPPTRRHR